MTDSKAIWIISLCGLVFSGIAFVARGWLRWGLLGLEDFFLVAAQVLACGQFAALFVSLHYGLGRASAALTAQTQATVSKAAFSSQMLLVLSLGLSKCSIVLLIRRLFVHSAKHCWLTCNILLTVFCVWLVGAVLLVSVGCDLDEYIPRNGNQPCVAFTARWNIIIALDVISELFIIILPVYFIWRLKIELRLKARVVLAFALRLPVSAFVITFSVLFTAVNIYPNRNIPIATALIWQQLELSYSLISATIPCLGFFTGFLNADSDFGNGPSDPYSSRNPGSKPNLRLQSTFSDATKLVKDQTVIKLQPLLPARRPSTLQKEVERKNAKTRHHVGRLRPERLRSSTTISAGAGVRRSDSRESLKSQTGSQEMIIRRDVHFYVSSVCAYANRASHSTVGMSEEK